MIERGSDIERVHFLFEPTHLAASQTRTELRNYLDGRGIEATVAGDVELAASELMANAVEQCPGDSGEVELHIDNGAVRLTVTNHRRSEVQADFSPAADEVGPLTDHGRGLSIVQAMADGMWLHGGSNFTSVSCMHLRPES